VSPVVKQRSWSSRKGLDLGLDLERQGLGLGLGLEQQGLGLGFGLDKKVLVTALELIANWRLGACAL